MRQNMAGLVGSEASAHARAPRADDREVRTEAVSLKITLNCV